MEVAQSRGDLASVATPGVGLGTLRERLRAHHGDGAAVGLQRREPAGVSAWFELPCER